MIEVVLDFKDIQTKEELIIYVSKELNIRHNTNGRSWDAFIDDFGDLFMRLPPKDYIYKDNDEWGFKDYDDYMACRQIYGDIGPKNSQGEKGDFRLILKNFNMLRTKLSKGDIDIFLKIILSKISDPNDNYDTFADWYHMEVCFKS
ncbi:hypothetical protein [Sulfurovum sp.]|jgi:hypothetical protein|uniref:hypothetical protein n=1 Tax=Sulfurovum sp. TaxID=1969726 RepID=UPI002A35B50A|nr:hypothetical protein [Sulfurovum sp.]MDY0403325.1 hypothetical protein [Sulfurovum sp.]